MVNDFRVANDVVEAFALPNFVRLGHNLYGAAFFLMKLLPARFMLQQAHRAGELTGETLVIETSSGTFGLALAMVCALNRWNLVIVSDPAIDAPLKRRMQDLGCRVEIIRDPAKVGGLQKARLDRVCSLREQYPDHFWPSQYDNPDNPASYAALADYLLETVGPIDCLVGPVGSGGSMCGTSQFLRKLWPHLYTIGVDSHGSVLFGEQDEKRLLRGLGNSIMPQNLDHRAFDEIHWFSAPEAFLGTRDLHRAHALYMGPTSGAAYIAARWWAERNPGGRAVVLLPDEGHRYALTVYNDQWLDTEGVKLHRLPSEPNLVIYPGKGNGRWTRMLWKRRSYDEVTGAVIPARVTA